MTEGANALVSLWQAFERLGCIGLLILGMLPLLLAACILIVALARSRGPWVFLWFLAVLPLGVGLLGTATGYAEVAQHQKLAGELADPVIAAYGRAMAWYPTYMGAGATGLLALVGIAGWALRARGAAPRDARAAARLDMDTFPSDRPEPPAPAP